MQEIKIGIIGYGTVGTGVAKILSRKSSLLSEKLKTRLILKTICDLDVRRKRNFMPKGVLFTRNVDKVLDDEQIQIVVELIGGINPAKEYIIRALKNKKFVVTANKALLAEAGPELMRLARKCGVDIYFEASVGAAIPVIKAIRDGLISNNVENIFGIINGTSNYILSEMTQNRCDFKSALRQARIHGFAERNFKLDTSGIDSAHKLVILSRLCFGQGIKLSDVYVEGINEIKLHDIQYADEFGYCIKLLAIAKIAGKDLQIRVHPTLLPKKHLLSNVNGVFNAIFITADLAGEMILYGQGAGQMPAASAVVSDLADISKRLAKVEWVSSQTFAPSQNRYRRISPIHKIKSRYYIRFMAIYKPGALSLISKILGKSNISICSVLQKGRHQGQAVPIIMMTHEAREKELRQALMRIDKLPIIRKKTVALRVESV
ncbi:MAG: homoserine dehydrogenase [Candidatus Omnitrophica bacterium]|nr:homoserine dehydrogenase [Candidatus Omnitrophota bacterium]